MQLSETNEQAFRDLLAECYTLAEKSPDPSNQNGAILFNPSDSENAAIGYNYFPPGVTADVEDRRKKYRGIVHAEMAALTAAARGGICTANAVMVCPWLGCCNCVKHIISAGISIVVRHPARDRHFIETRGGITDPKNAAWTEEIQEADLWMKKAGIRVYEIEGPVPYEGKGIYVNEKLWDPSKVQDSE